MADATVSTDGFKALDILGNLPSQSAFDRKMLVDNNIDFANLVRSQVLDPDVSGHSGFAKINCGTTTAGGVVTVFIRPCRSGGELNTPLGEGSDSAFCATSGLIDQSKLVPEIFVMPLVHQIGGIP